MNAFVVLLNTVENYVLAARWYRTDNKETCCCSIGKKQNFHSESSERRYQLIYRNME